MLLSSQDAITLPLLEYRLDNTIGMFYNMIYRNIRKDAQYCIGRLVGLLRVLPGKRVARIEDVEVLGANEILLGTCSSCWLLARNRRES